MKANHKYIISLKEIKIYNGKMLLELMIDKKQATTT